jgi:hypothetical protein
MWLVFREKSKILSYVWKKKPHFQGGGNVIMKYKNEIMLSLIIIGCLTIAIYFSLHNPQYDVIVTFGTFAGLIAFFIVLLEYVVVKPIMMEIRSYLTKMIDELKRIRELLEK